MSEQVYDCIIIGGGPAGLAAALYTSRDRFNTLVVEKFAPGGQIGTTDRIENYPGIERTSGPLLVEVMHRQAMTFGAKFKMGSEATKLEKLENGSIKVICDAREELLARSVILSPGSDYRKLGVPGETEFRNAGAGVSYCGTCDAPFFKGKKVVAVGGGNTAVEETLHLTKFAADVTLIHRRDKFRATQVLVEELEAKVKEPKSNLKLRLNAIITRIEGKDKVESVIVHDVRTGQKEPIGCDGVFIFIGMMPNTKFLEGFVELSEHGYIKVDCAFLRTSVPGVFAAGDCRIGAAMQLATAVGDGVCAAMSLKQYFRDPKWWNEPVGDFLMGGGW
jgi:thioredoxin reductase (NADPH)